MLLNLILVLLLGEQIIERKLTLYDLTLKVLWKLYRYSVRKRVSVIKFNVAFYSKFFSRLKNSQFELMLIVH